MRPKKYERAGIVLLLECGHQRWRSRRPQTKRTVSPSHTHTPQSSITPCAAAWTAAARAPTRGSSCSCYSCRRRRHHPCPVQRPGHRRRRPMLAAAADPPPPPRRPAPRAASPRGASLSARFRSLREMSASARARSASLSCDGSARYCWRSAAFASAAPGGLLPSHAVPDPSAAAPPPRPSPFFSPPPPPPPPTSAAGRIAVAVWPPAAVSAPPASRGRFFGDLPPPPPPPPLPAAGGSRRASHCLRLAVGKIDETAHLAWQPVAHPAALGVLLELAAGAGLLVELPLACRPSPPPPSALPLQQARFSWHRSPSLAAAAPPCPSCRCRFQRRRRRLGSAARRSRGPPFSARPPSVRASPRAVRWPPPSARPCVDGCLRSKAAAPPSLPLAPSLHPTPHSCPPHHFSRACVGHRCGLRRASSRPPLCIYIWGQDVATERCRKGKEVLGRAERDRHIAC